MVFFQTCSRTHSDRVPVVDTSQCWGGWCLVTLIPFPTEAESLEDNFFLSLPE